MSWLRVDRLQLLNNYLNLRKSLAISLKTPTIAAYSGGSRVFIGAPTKNLLWTILRWCGEP